MALTLWQRAQMEQLSRPGERSNDPARVQRLTDTLHRTAQKGQAYETTLQTALARLTHGDTRGALRSICAALGVPLPDPVTVETPDGWTVVIPGEPVPTYRPVPTGPARDDRYSGFVLAARVDVNGSEETRAWSDRDTWTRVASRARRYLTYTDVIDVIDNVRGLAQARRLSATLIGPAAFSEWRQLGHVIR